MQRKSHIQAGSWIAWVMLVTVSILLASPLHAQTTYGSILGTVTDASGAAVPGATVTVSNLGTSEARKVQSDATGNFSVVNLQPANYKVDVQKANFKRSVRQPVTVAVGATVRIDVSLQVGAITETVEVTSQAPLLQTDTGTLSTEIQGTTVDEMPLNGRNSMNLIALAAGVVPQGSTMGGTGMNQGNSGHTNWQGWNNYQIGGSLAGESSVYLDGAPNNTLGGNTVAMIMTQDAVQEFNVTSNSQTADFGRNGGAVVNMASKGGTNAFHGSVYEYLRNAAFNANEFFNKQAELQQGEANKPLKWNQNQYGAAFGGPVKKDKIFFHFTWEGFKADTASSQPGIVPTAEQQAGSIPAAAYNVLHGWETTPGSAYVPTCKFGAQNADGTYPITNLWSSAGCGDPMAKIMAGYYPLPTAGYNPGNGDNFFIAPATKDAQNQYNGRGDYVLSSKQRLFVRYTYWHLQDTGQALLGNYGGWQTQNSATKSDSQQAVLGDTYTFSPSTVLDVRLSFLRHVDYDSIPASFGTDPSKFAGTYYPAVASLMSARVLPVPSFGGTESFVNITRSTMLDGNFFNTYALDASVIRIQGNHSLKIGAEVRRMEDTAMGARNPSGQFNFSGAFTGDTWTDFLMGYIQSGQGFNAGAQLGLQEPVTNQNYYQAYYVSDTWQTTRRLTVTMGLRYELPGGIVERHNLNTVLLPNYQWTSGGVNVTGALGLVDSSLFSNRSDINVKHNLFAPRLGFAYRVGNDSAVRGGYGISYLAVDTGGQALAQSSPVTSSTSYCGSPTTGVPDAAQLMYNCFSAGNIIEPPRTTYNGGALVTDLGYLGNTNSSLSGPIPNQKYPYVQQWNLSVSHQMKGDLMMELGYAGSKGTHMPALGSNFNQIPDSIWLGNTATDGALNNMAMCAATGTVIAVAQCDRPYPWYGNVSDSLAYTASTTYHAMQFKAEKRFHSGGTLMGNYTWSKVIANTDSSVGNYLEASSGAPSNGPPASASGSIQDYDNQKAERSVMTYDVPQRAVVSYVLEMPFGHGQKWGKDATGVVDHVISGWGINGITTFQKGFHLAMSDNVNHAPAFLGGNGDLGSYGFGALRPNYTAGCNKMSGLTGSYASRVIAGTPQFNTSCWSQPADWTAGNAPRVEPKMFAQGIENFDLSIMKSTKVTEQTSVQFRAEFFNLFNRIQFAPPATQYGQTGAGGVGYYGKIFQTYNQPRLVQFSLRVNF